MYQSHTKKFLVEIEKGMGSDVILRVHEKPVWKKWAAGLKFP